MLAPVIDFSNLAAFQGCVSSGDVSRDCAGYGVSAAGDMNGDGFDNLIVGASNGSLNKAGATRSDIDLTGLAAAPPKYRTIERSIIAS